MVVGRVQVDPLPARHQHRRSGVRGVGPSSFGWPAAARSRRSPTRSGRAGPPSAGSRRPGARSPGTPTAQLAARAGWCAPRGRAQLVLEVAVDRAVERLQHLAERTLRGQDPQRVRADPRGRARPGRTAAGIPRAPADRPPGPPSPPPRPPWWCSAPPDRDAARPRRPPTSCPPPAAGAASGSQVGAVIAEVIDVFAEHVRLGDQVQLVVDHPLRPGLSGRRKPRS